MAIDSPYTPFHICPVGQYIEDEMEARGWSETELASRMGIDQQALHAILRNYVPLSVETAQKLAQALGTSWEVWYDLDQDYQNWRAHPPVSHAKTA